LSWWRSLKTGGCGENLNLDGNSERRIFWYSGDERSMF
jgi:hypothetical protein